MTAATLQNPDNHSKKAPAWRDVLPVHDAANLFPLISKDELGELAADIAKNGLLEGIAVHFDREGKCQLLDGRNRLDALRNRLDGTCLTIKATCYPTFIGNSRMTANWKSSLLSLVRIFAGAI